MADYTLMVFDENLYKLKMIPFEVVGRLALVILPPLEDDVVIASK